MTSTKPLNIINYIDYDSYTKALEKAFEDMINNKPGGTLYTFPRKGNSTFTYSLPHKYPNKTFGFFYKSESLAKHHKKLYIENGGTFNNNYPYFGSIDSNICGLGFNIVIIERPDYIEDERKYLSQLLTNLLPRTDKFIIMRNIDIHKYG